MTRRAGIVLKLLLALVIGIALLVGLGLVRVFFSPKPPPRDYRQEVIALSQSITAHTDEARSNSEQIVRAIDRLEEIAGEVYDTLPANIKESVASASIGSPLLLMQTPKEIAEFDVLMRAEYDFALRLYEAYSEEVSPLLDGLTPRSHFAPMWEMPSDPEEPLFNILLPEMSGMRDLARWEVVRLRDALDTGDADQAASALERVGALQAATHSTPFIIGRLVGIACLSHALNSIQDAVAREQVDPQTASGLLEVLLAGRESDPGLFVALEAERLGTLSFVEAAFSGVIQVDEYSDDPLLHPINLKLLSSERAVHERANEIYDTIVEAVEQGRLGQLDTIEDQLFDRGGMADRVIRVVVPSSNRWIRIERTTQVYRDAVMVMLALEAYRGTHNEYPETLEALIPEHLHPSVRSPWLGTDTPLRYRRLAENEEAPVDMGYLLWAIGPNGRDDGGVVDVPTLLTVNRWGQDENISRIVTLLLERGGWEGDLPLNITSERFFEMLDLGGQPAEPESSELEPIGTPITR